MQKKRWFIILLHVVGWALFFALPILLRPPGAGHERTLPPATGVRFNPVYFAIITNILVLPFFYLNLFFLVPKYISEKRYGRFTIIQIIIVTIIYLSKQSIIQLLFPDAHHFGSRQRFDVFLVFTYLLTALIAVTYGVIQDSIKRERIQKEKEHETLKSELQFLRWQISPHFLFNVLNNTVALARMKSEKLEPSLIKLSTLMRYMLYEADEHKISLKQEADYLKSYIDLQRLRTGDETAVNVNFQIEDGRGYTIEPMLLVPFVENAFKHGIGLIENPVIDITLKVDGQTLSFNVKNRNIPDGSKANDEVKGVGLNNVKRRLELLYANKHALAIDSDAQWFMVTLKIDLK